MTFWKGVQGGPADHTDQDSIFLEDTGVRVNAEVNDELWVLMTRQSRFILGDKCPSLAGDRACGQAGDVWEISVPPSRLL